MEGVLLSLEFTQYIPPKGCQHNRRCGLYASRTKGKWPDKPHGVRLAPPGWKKQLFDSTGLESQEVGKTIDTKAELCV
jgi:hypothetical protein